MGTKKCQKANCNRGRRHKDNFDGRLIVSWLVTNVGFSQILEPRGYPIKFFNAERGVDGVSFNYLCTYDL
jgi:hypothetical protein